MIIYIIVLVVFICTLLIIASYKISWGVYLKSLCRVDTDEREVVITFDDGPHPDYTPIILDLLKENGAKATFFVIGENARKHPQLIRRMSEEGHNIGIHSYYHKPTFTLFSKKSLMADLLKSKKLLEELSGTAINLFRPPYGVTNPNIGKTVRSMGLISIGWSIRSLDTVINNEHKVVARIDSKLSPGAIILLHDRLDSSVSILTKLLLLLNKRNYKITSL